MEFLETHKITSCLPKANDTHIISSLIPITKGAILLSNNTIVLFPTHPIFFSLFTGVGMIVFNMPHSFQNTFLWSILYTLGSIILIYPLSLMLFRFLPFSIGSRKNAYTQAH